METIELLEKELSDVTLEVSDHHLLDDLELVLIRFVPWEYYCWQADKANETKINCEEKLDELLGGVEKIFR